MSRKKVTALCSFLPKMSSLGDAAWKGIGSSALNVLLLMSMRLGYPKTVQNVLEEG